MKLEKRDPRNVCNPVLRALGAIGPPAKEALPLICEVIEASDNKDISRKSHAERAYQKISGIKLDPLGKIRMP
jgi:hypothetical protein